MDPEPQGPGGVEWHHFDQLNPELKMEPSTLACVEQHLHFMVLIDDRPLRKPESDIYCSSTA